MTQLIYSNNFYSSCFSPTFCGRNFVVRESKTYFEKLKINRKLDLELTREFYRVNQVNVPKWIKDASIKLENFFNLLTTPFISIKERDVFGVFDEKGKILGGFIGYEHMKRYQICGLFLENSIRRKKETPMILKSIVQNIKNSAENKKLNLITCEAYKKALPTLRLYKKAGFSPMLENRFKDMYSTTISLYAKVAEFGANILK